MFRLVVTLLTVLSLSGCIIVTREPDDGDSGAGGTEAADDTSALPACGDPGTFSAFDDAGNCVCEEGLVWCSADESDFSCCLPACGDPGTNSEAVDADECQCLEGFDWCTDDPDDINCCAV